MFARMTSFRYQRRLWQGVRHLAAGFAAVAVPAAVQAEDLVVKYDQSQILRLTRPAAEIIIGNPSIADVTIQSGNILVITGKSYGITNIIALDGERNVIQDQRIAVRRDEVGVVNLMRGTARQTYACLPQCNPTVTLGDDVTFLSQTVNSAREKIQFSEGHTNEKGTPGQGN
jgi:Flp pilus assembly secretin CpaC